jgi:hypothetical protein
MPRPLSLFVSITACALFYLGMATGSLWGQNLTVTATPGTVTIHPGDTNIPLAVSVTDSDYQGPISVTLTGLPSGISVAPLVLTGGGSGTLKLNASIFADQEGFSSSAPSPITTSTNTVTVVAAAGSAQATSTISLIVSISNPSFAPTPAELNLPVLRIDTGGQPIVDKTTEIPGTVTIASADGQTSYLPSSSNTDDTATLHLHGNSTLLMPKLAYHLKFNTSMDILTAMGVSCPYATNKGNPVCDKSKSYILLANYDDKTLLRDWSASALANAIPMGNGYLSSPTGSPSPSGTSTLMPWAPHSVFVELYLNAEYEGTYQLIEQVKVDSHRVNINELGETDTQDVSGGYLMEIDQRKDEAFVFTTPQGVPIGLVDPDFTPDPEVPDQTAYISNYVDTAENALFSSNFTDPTLGWRAYFDETAAINFYLVNDIMGNVDGGSFFSSDYLYKDKDNPLLYMGPIWDFDISAGNVNYRVISNPTVPWMQHYASWYAQLFKDPGFKADVKTQFNTLKNNGVFTAWINSITQKAGTMEQAQANNFARWPILGIKVTPNPEAAGSYDAEVAYMTTYLNLRLAYLDAVLNGKLGTRASISTSATQVRSGSPVTLTSQVTGGSNPGGTVVFMVSDAATGGVTTLVGGVTALDGSGNATQTVTNLPVGNDSVTAIYSGDSHNSIAGSSPVEINVLPVLVQSTTSIAVSTNYATGGDAVSFTTAVLGASGNTPPTGTATFMAGANNLGTAPLAGTGLATFSTTALPAGDNLVEVIYSGDNTYQGSTSPQETVEVIAVPKVTGVSPNAGQIAGGTSVLLTGENFFKITGVSFGGTPASQFTILGPTSIQATSPAHSSSGTVDATVTDSAGTSTLSAADQFTYQMPPVPGVTGISPNVGPLVGGTSVTITGSNFLQTTSVSFGGTPASQFTVLGPTSIQATSPAQSNSGMVDVTVTSGSGTSAISAADQFTYQMAPVFALTSTSTDIPIRTGGTATFDLAVNPQNGFNQAVSFSCSNLPVGASCTFMPAVITPGSAPVSTTVTIALAPATTASLKSLATPAAGTNRSILIWMKWGGGIAMAFLLWPAFGRRRWPFALLTLLIAVGLTSGCSNSKNTSGVGDGETVGTPVVHTITINATSGSISQSVQVNLDITN